MSKYRIVVEITDPEITDPIWMLQMKLEGLSEVHNTGIKVDSIQEVSGDIWEEIENEAHDEWYNDDMHRSVIEIAELADILQKHGVI